MSPPEEAFWTPEPARASRSQLAAFAAACAAHTGESFPDYWALHRWSVAQPAEFWSALARFTGVRFSRPAEHVLLDGERMPGARWFAGAELNFAEQLLRFHDDRPALIFRDEAGRRAELSYRELHQLTARAAAGLAARGVKPGDRVAAILPNHPLTVVAMLATASLGATWSSCSPDFGAEALLDRFAQITPSVLFVADGYRYGGKPFDCGARIDEVLARLPSVQCCVAIPFLGAEAARRPAHRTVTWERFLGPATERAFASLPFDHPLYILFSSGTTGAPKCIVHGAGGTLLQHLKEQVLHCDLRRDDRMFFFTTCGWMMWNWLVSALATGATAVLYDGSPLHPDPGVLWRMAEEEGVTVFGTSPRYLAALEQEGYEPRRHFSLAGLRLVLSTGSPLPPGGFDFVGRAIKPGVPLASISGGTDIVSCFALGNPLLPVYRGELQGPGLGMAVEIFDEAGQPLPAGKGELVCTRPFPSMPVGFWNDPDGARFRSAYFARFPGVWTHGDFAERTRHGGFIIHGRSDATLNPGGVRIGTAELYRALAEVQEIVEALAVGQAWQADTRIVLFVLLKPGCVLDDKLQQRIRDAVRRSASPRHVPALIIAVADLPRTRSGKLSELAVRAVIHGLPVQNLEALANPECLALFSNLPELS